MSDEEFEHDSDGINAWPAFVDLLAGTSLVFTTLVGIFIYVSNVSAAAAKGSLTQRDSLVRALTAAGDARLGERLYEVTDDSQFVRITLQEDATFPTREWHWSTLRAQGKIALTEIGAILERPDIKKLYRQVRVLGHTDQQRFAPGSEISNWELSAARAAVVARYLVFEVRMDPCKISAAGMGPYYPLPLSDRTIATLPYEQRMAKNRRIELEIVPALASGEVRSAPCIAWGDGSPVTALRKP